MRAVILCDKRTGSTFLQNALGSHPDIVAFDELFMVRTKAKKRHGTELFRPLHKEQEWSKKKYLDWVYEQGDNVVFKLTYNQCNYWKLLPFLKKEKIGIIHLIRRNLLKKAVSKYTKNIFKVKKINASPQDFLAEVKRDLRKRKVYIKSLKKYNHSITLTYEDIIGENVGNKENIKKRGAFNITSDMITYMEDESARTLCRFFDVEQKRLYTNVTRKNSENVWVYIKDKKGVIKMFKEANLMRVIK